MNRREARNRYYDNVHTEARRHGQEALVAAMRRLCREDLFYLLTRACGRADINRDWLFERCDEVLGKPDGMLDLWAREHYKSTIITFGKTIQDILCNPEITVGIFSHTKPIAKGFLRQIKREFEDNAKLQYLFSDVLYENPKKESPQWSEDKGIVVKRNNNPNAATVEAWGLVDGQPTSKHYELLVYDDVVTRESVTSAQMIAKVTEAWELSLNLGAEGGRKRMIGTRYHFNDTYSSIIKRGSVKPRIFPATDNGKFDGDPVFLSRTSLEEKRRDQGSYVFSCQQLQNPRPEDARCFNSSDIRYYDAEPELHGMNFYVLVDPANEKKKKSDYTAAWVLGLAADRNYYVFEIIRDKLGLTERADLVIRLYQQYWPVAVAYEHYGIQADIQHLEYLQAQRNCRFSVIPVGGSVSKSDRIRKLIPLFEASRFWFPRVHYYTDYEGRRRDMVQDFISEELEAFPVMLHDDLLDALARILDPDLSAYFPRFKQRARKPSWRDRLKEYGGQRTTFMAS